MLTARQYEILQFIQQFSQSEGYPPTIREIGGGVGIQSLRGVTGHLDALVRKGYIKRNRHARGLQLSGSAEGIGAPADVVSLPVLGRIAAGQPILAESTVEEQMVVDRRFVVAPGCFVVRVHGESMIQAGIHNGDYVIVKPQSTAINGEIVAVLIDGEATVKRFYKERNLIRLQPENRSIKPILLREQEMTARDIRVMGLVVGLMRKF